MSLSPLPAPPSRRARRVLPRLPRILTTVAVLTAAVLTAALLTATAAYAEPFSSFQNPADGAVLVAGVPVTMAVDAFNGEVGITSVEVTIDNGDTWQPVELTRRGYQFTFTPTEPGVLIIATRASTGDLVEVPHTIHRVVVVAAPGPVDCPCTLQLPELSDRAVTHDADTAAVELGLRFRTDRDGSVTGLVFRSYASDPSLLTGHLWSSDGTLLAEGGSPQPLPDGSFQVTFAAPVPVQVGDTYVVSYYTPAGDYASTEDYFTAEYPLPPFATVVDAAGGSGVYRYGVGGGFPDQTWHASNYWVGPVFTTT
jgi:hypothetical protein